MDQSTPGATCSRDRGGSGRVPGSLRSGVDKLGSGPRPRALTAAPAGRPESQAARIAPAGGRETRRDRAGQARRGAGTSCARWRVFRRETNW
ncbi:hypothetical protein QJS66_19460 [Kocuria rhizophila]|nr:hypothetical protein QJS66_19460 [Kocuria rhizophila]